MVKIAEEVVYTMILSDCHQAPVQLTQVAEPYATVIHTCTECRQECNKGKVL